MTGMRRLNVPNNLPRAWGGVDDSKIGSSGRPSSEKAIFSLVGTGTMNLSEVDLFDQD